VNTFDSDSYVTAEIYGNGALPRRRDASRAGLGVLGPPFLYQRFDPDPLSADPEVLASPIQGSVFVNVSGGNPLSFIPPLASGDTVSIGDPLQLDPRENSILRPPFGTVGVTVRVVIDSQARFRLQEPWSYNSSFLQPLHKAIRTVRVRVSAGIAQFDGLSIDRVGRDYTLRFVSSLRPEPEGTLIGRGRRGFGRVGYGYGYGLPNAAGAASQPLAGDSALSDAAAIALAESMPNITAVSAPFAVSIGPPASMIVARPAVGAWAGGQPFRV